MLPCFKVPCVIYLCWFRDTWANYFDKEGVSYAFWSAHLETAKIDVQAASGDKENSCVDDNHQEKQQQENEEDLDLLPQAMVRGFMLEDECATMTVDHEKSSEVPDKTNDDHLVMEIADTACASASNHEKKTTENVAIATQLPSQTAAVDDITRLPSDHETTQPSDVTKDRNCGQTIPTTDDCLDDTEMSHTAVESNVESSSSPDTADIPVTNPRAKLLTCSELLDLFRSFYSRKVGKKAGEPVVVGMVGYPNVGKSSTINTLIQEKKVPVSATPGRTKHFQVISLQ